MGHSSRPIFVEFGLLLDCVENTEVDEVGHSVPVLPLATK